MEWSPPWEASCLIVFGVSSIEPCIRSVATSREHASILCWNDITSITVDPLWKLNHERSIMFFVSVFHVQYVQVLHDRQILTAIRLKVWTSSGTSHWFYPQQDLHFSTEAGFEQRVWLLSLLVKCLKKTCNLNWCRAHQYEIGWTGGGVGGWGLRRQPSTWYARVQQLSLFPPQQLRVGLNLWRVFHCC